MLADNELGVVLSLDLGDKPLKLSLHSIDDDGIRYYLQEMPD